ncbi:MAG: M28 family peptidase, partial [Planctomycetota bacterium JB042]
PPFFQDADMGSLRYAERLRTRGVAVAAMISLESLGYYDDAEGSQLYPPGIAMLYPSTGDFVGFVTNVEHGDLVRRAIETFRAHATIPSEGASLPGAMPGIGWSDHWSFWQIGVPAFMVTDTATFRDPTYHTPRDTPERLDYARMARVVDGLEPVIEELAGE